MSKILKQAKSTEKSLGTFCAARYLQRQGVTLRLALYALCKQRKVLS